MLKKRFLIKWVDGLSGKRRKASITAFNKSMAFRKLLKHERYEESLFLTFGKDVDRLGHECVNIRECDCDTKIQKDAQGKSVEVGIKAIYM